MKHLDELYHFPEELQTQGKLLNTVWVDTEMMIRLGSDGLSRQRFDAEGYTISTLMTSKLQRQCDQFFGLLDSRIVLDAFCSPSQNVLKIAYLARTVNELDPLCLKSDFFEFNFDAYRRGGVFYSGFSTHKYFFLRFNKPFLRSTHYSSALCSIRFFFRRIFLACFRQK